MNKKKNQEKYLDKCIQVHGIGTYDYSKTIYNGSEEKLIIICPQHGEFLQTAKHHLSGCGCTKCGNDKKGPNLTQKQYLENCIQIHGVKFDYSEVVYNGSQKKIVIICPQHGKFIQRAGSHLQGTGCPYCGNEAHNLKLSLTQDEYLERCFEIYEDTYDYSKTVYLGCKIKIVIICDKHGEFLKLPFHHLSGQGCPDCSNEQKLSKGERQIFGFLEKNNVALKLQYEFPDCRGKRNKGLPFDFALLDKSNNVLAIIEFHGEQHYKPIDYWNGKKGFERRQELDRIKKNYCISNKIPFLEIPYWEINDVPAILENWISNQFCEV